MNIIVNRNGNDFGPYPEAVAQQYLDAGKLLPQDLGRLATDPPTRLVPLSKLLASKQAGSAFSLRQQLANMSWKMIPPLIMPLQEIFSLRCFKNSKMLYLASAGLIPIFAAFLLNGWLLYWAIAFYFSALWAIFFYGIFHTNQVKLGTCVLCFFFTALVGIPVILFLQLIPPWSFLYHMVEQADFLGKALGFYLGVGINEEMAKAAILFWLVRRPGKLLVPQTAVVYGMMSGLGFGIYEGVHYQMHINSAGNVHQAYFLNMLRLTSLPFLHAIWTGIAGYFIGFAGLYPKHSAVLFLLAIAIPAFFHGTYDLFTSSIPGMAAALISVMALTTYLSNSLNVQKQLTPP